jgi:hypothetical protein
MVQTRLNVFKAKKHFQLFKGAQSYDANIKIFPSYTLVWGIYEADYTLNLKRLSPSLAANVLSARECQSRIALFIL